jgi:hypothetical protein
MANARSTGMEKLFSRRQPPAGIGRIETMGTENRACAQPRTTKAKVRQRKMERALGIEPTRKVVSDLENKHFGAIMNAKCDGRVSLGGTWGNVGILDTA